MLSRVCLLFNNPRICVRGRPDLWQPTLTLEIRMAFQDEILQNPLTSITEMLQTFKSLQNLNEVAIKFKESLQDRLSEIPCINETRVEAIAPNSLVRFRGMVQDMFDPEFYLGKFELCNQRTSEKKYKFGCYTDTGNCQADEEILFESDGNITLERQRYYCVPIPGENQWIKNIHAKNNKYEHKKPQESPTSKSKRPLDDENEDMELDSINQTGNKDETEHSQGSEKKAKSNGDATMTVNEEKNKPAKSKTDFTKNFPLPEERGSPCFVTLYSNFQELKVNDVADFVCVLSVDPEFATNTMEQNSMEMSLWPAINRIEEEAHSPPPSLVPRLHCVFFNKHANTVFQQVDTDSYDCVKKELSSIRADFIQLLTKIVGGDNTVAEYLLLHLISKVYGRYGGMCIGKMSLNITRCPNNDFTTALYQLISLLVEKSYFLPMTLENLNNKQFIPAKDYDANRLVSGILQLSEGTHLVLDETKMQPGKLDVNGLKNLTAIGNMIQWQKVEYDFKFNKVEMSSNVNVLVLSEGKSLLTCDCRIALRTDKMETVDASSVLSGLSNKLLDRFRMYLAVVRDLEYNLTEEIQKALEEDFVDMRKEDSKTVNADSFTLLLTTARYMALSYGQNTLSASLWTRTKELDRERINRLTL